MTTRLSNGIWLVINIRLKTKLGSTDIFKDSIFKSPYSIENPLHLSTFNIYTLY